LATARSAAKEACTLTVYRPATVCSLTYSRLLIDAPISCKTKVSLPAAHCPPPPGTAQARLCLRPAIHHPILSSLTAEAGDVLSAGRRRSEHDDLLLGEAPGLQHFHTHVLHAGRPAHHRKALLAGPVQLALQQLLAHAPAAALPLALRCAARLSKRPRQAAERRARAPGASAVRKYHLRLHTTAELHARCSTIIAAHPAPHHTAMLARCSRAFAQPGMCKCPAWRARSKQHGCSWPGPARVAPAAASRCSALRSACPWPSRPARASAECPPRSGLRTPGA